MRLLIIEADDATAQTLEMMVVSHGFTAHSTGFGEEGVDLAKRYEYDLITLDMHLPDITGLEVLRRIRAAGVKTPVIVCCGDHLVETKVRAFGAGADDYLTKPFHKDELIARALAVVRRSKGHAEAALRIGRLSVCLDRRQALIGEEMMRLTGKEYSTLEMLALRSGSLVTRLALLDHLYGGMDEPEMKILDVFICRLRKKLAALNAGAEIQTVWGRGYVLKQIEPLPAAA